METIIVPTDFSAAASNAVEYAVGLAKFFSAQIVLVNAFPVPSVSFEMPYLNEPVSLFQKLSEERLDVLKSEIQAKSGGTIAVNCLANMGSPFSIIEETVREMNGDLVVMGIVGEAGNLKERIVGSTSVSVARNLDVPTFIIPESVKYKPIRKISFACDLEHTEKTDLVHVVKFFSKVFDAELEIVNVGPSDELITTEKAVSYLYMEDKLKNVKHATFHIDGNDIPMELENYFRSYPTDVIILNPKKHNLFYHLLNYSVTKNLAFHSNLPILAIH